jgi:hypothetical protein
MLQPKVRSAAPGVKLGPFRTNSISHRGGRHDRLGAIDES